MPVRTLKRGMFGRVFVAIDEHGSEIVVRDARDARWWARGIAARLCAREARALAALDGVAGVPRLLLQRPGLLARSLVGGRAMHEAQPRSRAYFADALRLLAALHRRGVAHDDLAKEANWLCTPDGRAALVDFQLAVVSAGRGRWYRTLAYEDLRHLLKHKRTYLPERLTARERRVLAHPSPLARAWRALVKPPYRFVTRRVLGWPERTGPAERTD